MAVDKEIAVLAATLRCQHEGGGNYVCRSRASANAKAHAFPARLTEEERERG